MKSASEARGTAAQLFHTSGKEGFLHRKDSDLFTKAGVELTEETSLVDFLRARDGGLKLQAAAAAFKSGLADFAASGRNLYGRMLMGPSDAEGLVDYPLLGGQRQMIIL